VISSVLKIKKTCVGEMVVSLGVPPRFPFFPTRACHLKMGVIRC